MLNPFGEIALSPADRERIGEFGVAALDCSWEHDKKVMGEHVRGTSRCLPILLAGNPVNFGKLTKLSTAEAIAATLYITGFQSEAHALLEIFPWGHTFFELNQNSRQLHTSQRQRRNCADAKAALCRQTV